MDYVILFFFLLVSFIGLISLVFGLPGNFIILGASFLLGWYGGFNEVTVTVLIVLAGLALIGELIEFVLGVYGSKRYKSSNKAILGSIVFGIAGGVLGLPFFLGVGAVIGAFLGAFAGAFLVELLVQRKVDSAVKSGWGAFIGRVAGAVSKAAIGMTMIVITVVSVVRN
jgi:uncharacterized protein YqgC (DUF456 family)